MHRPLDPGDFDGAMEQTASLEPEMRNVLILARDDRVVRQNRVAVMAVLIHHVAAVGGVPPHIGSQELVLRLLRPGGVPAGMQVVYALDFLEKDQVGAECPQSVAQFVHDHVPIELGKSLVDVVRRDA